MDNIFVTPKIYMPTKPSNIVERLQLEHHLTAHAQKRLVILKAPAGYGKTTTLNYWLQKQGTNTAWISLDESDNQTITFWKYIVTAITKIVPLQRYDELMQLLYVQSQNSFELFLYSLIEEITHIPTLRIVLDDYHYIHSEIIHHLFTIFIENLPPNIHVYITTRTAPPLPLMKWHVKQWVYELNLQHFQFTKREMKQYLQQTEMYKIDEKQLEQIYTETEGWISGLLLMVLANQHNDTFNIQTTHFTADFLWEEIVSKLPENVQQFLLKTSFLRELTPTLCDDLTDQTNSAQMLEQLDKQGLFTVKLQANTPTYRYHYLMQNALQQQYFELYTTSQSTAFIEKVATIHCEYGNFEYASNLLIRNGLHETAAAMLDHHLEAIIHSNQIGAFASAVKEIVHADVRCTDDVLLMGFIQAILILDFTLAQQLLTIIEQRFEEERWSEDDTKTNSCIYYISAKAMFYSAIGDRLPEVVALLQQRLQLPYTIDRWNNILINYNNFEVNILRTSLASKGKMVSQQQLENIVKLFKETELNEIDVAIHIFSVNAAMLYEQNYIEKALVVIEEVITHSLQNNLPHVYIPMYMLKAKIFIQTDRVAAARILTEQMQLKVHENYWKNAFNTMLAQCYIAENDIDNAKRLLQEENALYLFDRLIYAKLLLKEQNFEQALHAIIDIQMTAKQEEQFATIIEATIFEALCHNGMGQTELALHALHQMLPSAAKYFYVRLFLDNRDILPLLQLYVQHPMFSQLAQPDVLAHISHVLIQANSMKTTIASQPLTEREKEILTLIAEGNTNKEIAAKLFLSEGTIRVYISTLYQKINVKSRSQAIKYFQQNSVYF